MANVLITGSNRGIGLELAKQYAERGDHVLAACRNPAGADDLQALAGENLSVHALVPTDGAAAFRRLDEAAYGRDRGVVAAEMPEAFFIMKETRAHLRLRMLRAQKGRIEQGGQA